MSDVSITPNTDDPRSARLREDGVDIDAPDFDAEADEQARKERQEAVQAEIDANSAEPTETEKAAGADETTSDDSKTAKADTSAKPKTQPVPTQAPAASGDSSSK
jgi:hypothetical protein